MTEQKQWIRVADKDPLDDNSVASVVAGVKTICLVKYQGVYSALDNHCPHQGGPLGEGLIENGYVVCPWHGYEYGPSDGKAPGGYDDHVTTYPLAVRDDGIYVAVPAERATFTIAKQMMEVAADWGLTHVFGMVSHSNLAIADAIREQESKGRMRFIGVRHEGAAAFAASGYAKLTGRPAACLGIAGPGSTNLLTGLWDAKVDRVPIIALSGQVQTQVLGPGAFQEIDLAAAFSAVAEWSQTVLSYHNASELMALAMKHAIVNRDVAHLIFPDEIAFSAGHPNPPHTPRDGRISAIDIAPPSADLARALELLRGARLVTIIVGHGAREYMDSIIALAERIQAPIITTFKGKGLVSDAHPLACGVLGRSGTPVASSMMGRADVLLVFGASFSNHTGISAKKKIIQVDFDRMALGKFHPVTVPLWGDIGVTARLLYDALQDEKFAQNRAYVPREIAARWSQWRKEKQRRAGENEISGVNSAELFHHMSEVVPEEAIIAVDVGNNTYSFGRYFETKRGQDVLMSGYLGSIGFAFPAAIGAACAAPDRPIWAVAGDGGFGQYALEFTTAVKYRLPIKLVLLVNNELGKISKEQRGAELHVWQTDLVNPHFADFAVSCGGWGLRVRHNDEVRAGLAALARHEGPGILELMTDALKI